MSKMLKRMSFAAVAATLAATPALAVQVSETTPVNAAPEKVWATVGDFCGIARWHPAIEGCAASEIDRKPGRTLSLKGGGTIVEQQTGRDDAAMKYSYRIIESPLPVSNYLSTIEVRPSGSGGSSVNWTGEFDAKGASDAEAKGVIDGIYIKGLAGIVDNATK